MEIIKQGYNSRKGQLPQELNSDHNVKNSISKSLPIHTRINTNKEIKLIFKDILKSTQYPMKNLTEDSHHKNFENNWKLVVFLRNEYP